MNINVKSIFLNFKNSITPERNEIFAKSKKIIHSETKTQRKARKALATKNS